MEKTHALYLKRVLPMLVLFLLSGCAGPPATIREAVSSFDGATETAMEPSYICSPKSGQPCSIRLGLFKRSTMAPDSVILFVVVDSSDPIAEGESLLFRVNDSVSAFSTIDRKTRYAIGKGPHTTGTEFCGSANCSVKRYLVSRDFLKSVTDAREVSMRVLLKKGYMGGLLVDGGPGLALPRFREFYARVFGQ